MTRALAAAVAWIAAAAVAIAVAAPARAGTASEDAAKAAVEAERDDVHRKRVRIDWPETPDAVPPDGAEATLIEGYIEYRVTRIVRRGDRVEGRTVAMCRNWFYGSDERFDAEAFDVPLDAFATAWNAARRVDGAKAVRIDEPSGKLGGRFGSGSHESSLWVRLRDGVGADAEPWHASVQRGSSSDVDDVRDWGQIRDRAVFRLVADLVPKEGRRPAPFAEWGPWCTAEIVRTTPVLSTDYGHVHRLLVETSLRGAGEVGGPDALAAVEALDARLRKEPDVSDYGVSSLLDECWAAGTKLRLRHDFDPRRAAAVLTQTERRGGWRLDVIAWTRRRWREADPASYDAFLRATVADASRGPDVIVDALTDLAAAAGTETTALVRPLLVHAADTVRAAAAALVLAADRRDAGALAVLAAAGDGSGPLFEPEPALRAALAAGREDGRWVRAALATLPRSRRRGSDDDVAAREALELAAWRGVLAQPEHPGTRFAVERLLALRDRPSYARMTEILDRWSADAAALDASGMSRSELEITRSQLREAETVAPPK